MEKRIQDLTDKLYQEGVEKGKAQAKVIIAEANENAAQIIADAKAQAEAILLTAQKSCSELQLNTVNELKLYTGQTVEAAKGALADSITNQVVEIAVKSAFEDKTFMHEIILHLVSEWGKKEDLIIETEDASSLTAFFAAKVKQLLDRGITISEVNGRKHSFAVMPSDGAYKIVFGENEFVELFKDFLRPALVDLLYKS